MKTLGAERFKAGAKSAVRAFPDGLAGTDLHLEDFGDLLRADRVALLATTEPIATLRVSEEGMQKVWTSSARVARDDGKNVRVIGFDIKDVTTERTSFTLNRELLLVYDGQGRLSTVYRRFTNMDEGDGGDEEDEDGSYEEALKTDEIWTLTYDAAGRSSRSSGHRSRATTVSFPRKNAGRSSRTSAPPRSSTRASPTRARDVTTSFIIAALAGVFGHEPVGDGAAVPTRASEACGGCHGAAFADWSGSGHASAWTSPLFRAGFQVEPRRFCVECHAPVAERAAEGIGCLGCHEARSAAPAPGHVAALRSREELRSATACKDCHEFATPAFDDGAARPTSLPMQSTYSEWVAYRRAGGGETCQGCHMPQGRHVMSGAHDVESAARRARRRRVRRRAHRHERRRRPLVPDGGRLPPPHRRGARGRRRARRLAGRRPAGPALRHAPRRRDAARAQGRDG